MNRRPRLAFMSFLAGLVLACSSGDDGAGGDPPPPTTPPPGGRAAHDGPVRYLDCGALGYRTCAMKADPVEPHATCAP